MTEQVILTKEELNQIIESALKRCQHDSPSKGTQEMFDALNVSLADLRKDMEPVIELFHTVGSINKFLKWGGMSLFAFIAAMYLLFKRL